jgi:hypothetical protein
MFALLSIYKSSNSILIEILNLLNAHVICWIQLNKEEASGEI